LLVAVTKRVKTAAVLHATLYCVQACQSKHRGLSQRNCGSGLGAIISAAHAITCGEGDVIFARGVESMTRAPFVVGKSEQAFGKQFVSFDSALGARFPNPEIEKEFGSDNMPQTANNLAEKYRLSRKDCDTFSF
jgi:acetyl-CoA C-acetyltransferase